MIAHLKGYIPPLELHRLWQSELSTPEIAAMFGVSPAAISAKASRMKLGRRPVREGEVDEYADLSAPTPEEIARACEEFREKWSRRRLRTCERVALQVVETPWKFR